LWRIRSGGASTFVEQVRGHADAAGRALPEHVERQLQVLETINTQVKAADHQVR